jgi:hypothetical protein
MSEQQPQQGQQQVQLRIDESKMQTTYANTIRTSTTNDELIMDFGLNIPMQNPGQQPMLVFSIGSRVVMNWSAAKRLAMTVGGAVRQYEDRFGEIEVQGSAPAPQTPPNN